MNNKKQKTERVVGWVHHRFTLNNYDLDDVLEMMEHCQHKDVKYYVWQEEKGDLTGTPHLQGFIEYHKKQRWDKYDLNYRIKWLPADYPKQAAEYCSKERTKNGALFTNIPENYKEEVAVADPMDGLELKVWQHEILEIIKKPADKRKIYWYWDAMGAVGKTSFAKHLCLKHEALYLTGKAADIKFGVMKWVEMKKMCGVAVFYYTRDHEGFVSYQALEEIKDGMFFSGKYEGGMVLFNTPHVVVFANFAPDESKLSRDRWEIRNITEGENFIS